MGIVAKHETVNRCGRHVEVCVLHVLPTLLNLLYIQSPAGMCECVYEGGGQLRL
jgi:hypothetical protein